MLSQYKYETLRVSSPKEFVYHVEINRPEKRNAMNLPFWKYESVCRRSLNLTCILVITTGLRIERVNQFPGMQRVNFFQRNNFDRTTEMLDNFFGKKEKFFKCLYLEKFLTIPVFIVYSALN